MGSIVYLLIGILFGYAVCETLFPDFKQVGETTFDGRKISMSSYFLRIPAWVLAGVLPLAWATYLTAYALKVFGGKEYPLFTANVLVMILFAAISAALLVWKFRKTREKGLLKNEVKKIKAVEWIFLAVLLLFVTQMMFLTFFIKDEQMYVGLSVFSDFAPHLGMIRSFSYGNNFPTAYAHFAGEDIKYHFMFQFLVGNLEFLGMRLDFAFNLPSIFGLTASCVLLYALAVRLSGKRSVGYLTTLFFLFRSSPSFFRYLAEIPKEDVVTRLKEQVEFISYTPYEGWGLWNLNVYCNQRHLAFAIAVMLLALHFFLPYVYAMAEKLSAKRSELSEQKATSRPINVVTRFTEYATTFFFTKTAFGVKHPVRALSLGILLGALAFFNGSVLIACCAMLFFMAVVSDYRLDYLITALTALVLSVLESKLFIEGSAVSVQYFFGFIAPNKSFFGILDYMWQLWGILLLFVGAYLLLGRGVKRYLVIVFTVPLVLAFTVFLIAGIKVAPETMYLVEYYVTVNHKFVMLAEMLLSVFPAIIIAELWEKRSKFFENGLVMRRVTAVLLVVFMTVTGLCEYIIVQRRNMPQNNLVYNVNDSLTLWVKENADSDDVILSAPYALHPVVLGGGMLYCGHSYYAQSAGYDTASREEQVKAMYEASSVDELRQLAEENNIRYIIVDNAARTSTSFFVREDVLEAAYAAVYTEGEGDWKVTIYDTAQPLAQ
ncbi:MAG: hypothetical protein IJW37_09970 [Lachnospiraceae bacterium]|nr:hypothetical protein [Lachnospiraceae bacterium]